MSRQSRSELSTAARREAGESRIRTDEVIDEQQPVTTDRRHSPSEAAPQRVLRFPAVRERTGLSRSTIWRLERRGQFPRHRRISANAVGWSDREVNEWVESRLRCQPT